VDGTQRVASAYLAELVNVVPAVENLIEHAQIIAGHAKTRRIESVVQLIAAEVRTGVGDVDAWAQSVERRVFEVCQHASRREETLFSSSDLVTLKLAEIAQQQTTGISTRAGITTGLPALDKMLGGWQPGLKYEIGARPGMGKTGLGLSFAIAAASQAPVIFISAEMPALQLRDRALAQISGIEQRDVTENRFGSQYSEFTQAADAFSRLPIFIEESGDQSPSKIRSAVRRATSRLKASDDTRPVGLIVIDYIQLIEAENMHRGAAREERVTAVSNATRKIAKEFNCAVVELAQLNREVEKRPDKRPQLSDLRESGAIEQDAYAVIFLFRDDYYQAKEGRDFKPNNQAELIIAKHRNGPLGTVTCEFEGCTTRFFEAPTIGDEFSWNG